MYNRALLLSIFTQHSNPKNETIHNGWGDTCIFAGEQFLRLKKIGNEQSPGL